MTVTYSVSTGAVPGKRVNYISVVTDSNGVDVFVTRAHRRYLMAENAARAWIENRVALLRTQPVKE